MDTITNFTIRQDPLYGVSVFFRTIEKGLDRLDFGRIKRLRRRNKALT